MTTITYSPTQDAAVAEAFAERMLAMLNEGALALMISIGHRTHLFDTLSLLPPATSEQIAEAAKLNERYVREWLGAMVVGKIVTYDPAQRHYYLPSEHAMWLTRETKTENLARLMQYIPLLGQVEDGIIDSFHNGGGVPYAAYGRFQEVMADDSSATVVAALIDSILPLEPSLIPALEEGIDVLEIGCGRGHALNLMAQAFPSSYFTGYDISVEGIIAGRAEAKSKGLANTDLQVQDVATLDAQSRYDLAVAFDAIHDQAQPDRVLANIYRALRPGAIFLMQDIAGSSHLEKNLTHPAGPFLYTVSTMHCMSVSLAENGAGLGTMWGEEKALEMLAAAGFTGIRVEQLPHDVQNSYYVAVKPL
jgi:SAM-dependent methyltransferase